MRKLLGTLAVLVVVPLSLPAQRLADLPSGTTLRIKTVEGGQVTGRLENVSENQLILHVKGKGTDAWTNTYRRESITHVERRRGGAGAGALKGALLGLLIGGGGGFILGAATYSGCDIIVCSAAEAGAFVGLLGAVVGVPIGTIAGAAKGSYRWEPVSVKQ